MASKERKQIIQAIRQLKLVVTPADIVDKTGLPILLVSRDLNKLATDTKAKIEITDTGQVIYRFLPQFGTLEVTEKITKFASDFASASLYAILFLMKTALIVSMFVLAICIDGQASSARELIYSLIAFLLIALFGEVKRDTNERNLLIDFFHYIFGEKDPNYQVEDRKWQLLARKIDQNNNTLTTEQMAPFTGLDPAKEESAMPVLARFGGIANLTESGNIVYSFPQLQNTAKFKKKSYGDSSVRSVKSTHSPTPLGELFRLLGNNDIQGKSFRVDIDETDYLVEAPWTLCNASAERMRMFAVVIVAGFIFSLALFLISGHVGIVSTSVFRFLFIPFSFLLLFPTLRAWLNASLNDVIDERNKKRKQYAKILKKPDKVLGRKLNESKRFGTKDSDIRKGVVVFTSNADSLEQNFRNEPRKKPPRQ